MKPFPQPSQIDRVFATRNHEAGSFQFDETVAEVFPDMLQRSIPGYNAIVNETGAQAKRYIQLGTNCYDLGCSLGASMLSIHRHMEHSEYKLVGVDNSVAMVERCRVLIEHLGASANHLSVELADVEDLEISNASFVALNYTLQFVKSDRRDDLINSVYQKMVPGGGLILSEKVASADQRTEVFLREKYYEFKRSNGYSELEISQKRDALENVLVTEPLDKHISRLFKAGFSRVVPWFQYYNFFSLIAEK